MALAPAPAATYPEIQSAVRGGDFNRIESMIQQDGGVESYTAATFMWEAGRQGNPGLLDRLLTIGISPEASPAGSGETALMQAVCAGRTDTVRFLLSRGANPNYIGRCKAGCKGHAALFGAAKSGDLELTRMLLEAGADPNIMNGCVIEAVNSKPDLDVYELLLKHRGREPAALPATNQAVAKGNVPSATSPTALKSLGVAEFLPRMPAAAPQAEKTNQCRLAIIADDQNVAAADMLVARLSAQPSVELVERQEIDRILAEQKLTRQFAASAANYGRMATLLRADALLLVRTILIANSKAVEARYIRVYPGIVLDTSYREAPLADARGWAQELSRRIPLLAARTIRRDAIAVSLLEPRASIQTPVTRSLEHTLGVLLRDRFVHHPRFLLLERAEMGKVAAESTGKQPFWAGSYLIDPGIEPALDSRGGFSLTIRLQPSRSQNSITLKAAGNRAAPATVVDEIMQAVAARLGDSSPPPARDVAAEANEYFTEARWALAAGMAVRAQTCMEAAWALGVRTTDAAHMRVRSAMQAVRELSQRAGEPNPPSSADRLDMAIQGAIAWRELLDPERPGRQPAELRAWLDLAPEVRDGAMLALISVNTASEQLRQAQRMQKLRDVFWDAIGEAWTRSQKLPADPALASSLTQIQAGTVRLMLTHPAELVAALRDIFGRHFAANDALTRAAIRADFRWAYASVMVQETRTSASSRNLTLPKSAVARRQFIEFLRGTQAPEDRFFATTLETETDATSLGVRETALLMESFWDMRDLLAKDGNVFEVYYRRFFDLTGNEPINGDVYKPRLYTVKLSNTEGRATSPVEMTGFEFRRRLFIYLVDHATKQEPQFGRLIVPSQYSPEQLSEVQAAEARYSARTGAAPSRYARVRRFAGVSLNERPASTPAGAPSSLEVNRFWHPFGLGLNIAPEFRFQDSSMFWQEGRLWCHGYVHDFSVTPPVARRYIFAVELPSMRTTTYRVPVTPAGNNDAMFVLNENMFVLASIHNFLAIGDRTTGQWNMYAEIKPAYLSAPLLDGEWAYLIAEDATALVRFHLKERRTEVVASTRRRPAATPLDDPVLTLKGLWKNEAGEIMVASEGLRTNNLVPKFLHAWSPARRQWRSVQMPERKAGTPPRTTPASQNAVYQVGRAAVRANSEEPAMILKFAEGKGPPGDILIDFSPPPSRQLPDSIYGPQKLISFDNPCYVCPAGYLFTVFGGPGFWFLPDKDLKDYISLRSPTQMARP